MVRSSRQGFLGGSALTLAALTGVLDPATDSYAPGQPIGTPADLDLDISAPFADALLPVPADDELSTTYATVIAERIDADAVEDPVEPGSQTVRVVADEHSVTVDAQDRITDDQTCIRLQFYLGSETIHSEYQLYDRCE